MGKAHSPSTGPHQGVEARSPGSGGRLGSLGAVESGGVDESGRGEKQGPDASATRQQGDGPDPAVSAGFSGRGGELAKAAFRNTA